MIGGSLTSFILTRAIPNVTSATKSSTVCIFFFKWPQCKSSSSEIALLSKNSMHLKLPIFLKLELMRTNYQMRTKQSTSLPNIDNIFSEYRKLELIPISNDSTVFYACICIRMWSFPSISNIKRAEIDSLIQTEEYANDRRFYALK